MMSYRYLRQRVKLIKMPSQDDLIKERKERARAVLKEIFLVPLATVNEDNSPHLSPVFLAFDKDLNGYWNSSAEALHSQNIVRTGQVFLVIFDSSHSRGGLYMEAEAKELSDQAEIEQAWQAMDARKRAIGDGMAPLAELPPTSCFYKLTPHKFFINYSDRDEQGHIIKDNRIEISRSDLMV